jgi:hypothetical protein
MEAEQAPPRSHKKIQTDTKFENVFVAVSVLVGAT